MNAKIRSYRELEVWQLAEELFGMICEDYRKLPKNKIAWVIGDQAISSVGSIGANIAEGFARKTKKEFIYFLNVARGSNAESEVWIERMRKQKLITSERCKNYIEKFTRVAQMINALIRSPYRAN
ncbi:MAG: four helix bundle protein [Patescibacteria group bacterium]